MYKNYNISNQDITNEDFSTNYFMFKLLQFAGLPLDKTSEYLKTLNEEYPIIGINSGVYDKKGNKISDYENILNKYLGLMYYRLFDSQTINRKGHLKSRCPFLFSSKNPLWLIPHQGADEARL